MGIFKAFGNASRTIKEAQEDIDRGRRNRPRDEVADKRAQKGNGKQK
jgi:hypothetical protein